MRPFLLLPPHSYLVPLPALPLYLVYKITTGSQDSGYCHTSMLSTRVAYPDELQDLLLTDSTVADHSADLEWWTEGGKPRMVGQEWWT